MGAKQGGGERLRRLFYSREAREPLWQAEHARRLGLHESSFSLKLDGKRPWKREEVQRTAALLNERGVPHPAGGEWTFANLLTLFIEADCPVHL